MQRYRAAYSLLVKAMEKISLFTFKNERWVLPDAYGF
jgi:hypothetical protein